jgi:hypothetical protein
MNVCQLLSQDSFKQKTNETTDQSYLVGFRKPSTISKDIYIMPHPTHPQELDTYDAWVAKLAKSGFKGHEAEVCAELLACADTDKANGERPYQTPGHLEYLRYYKPQLAKAGVTV